MLSPPAYQRFVAVGILALSICSISSHVSASVPTEGELSREPGLVSEWANRVTASDPKDRAKAEAVLVEGAGHSLPLLRRLLRRPNEQLRAETFEVLRRIGPPAIPLLADLLQDERVSVRQNAADALIDLAPETERVQSELKRALADADSFVARDAARALGALGPKAAPSVATLAKALSHEEAHVRLYAAEALASIGPKAASGTKALARLLA